MTTSGPIPIIRRRVDIDFSDAPARNWYPNEQFWEQVLNATSYFFPSGERFFIKSLQNYEQQITDPVLREQMKQFIYQEAMHTREHLECNKLLSRSFALGPAIDRMTSLFMKIMGWTPPSFQLAISCAIEHYTATMSDYMLRRQEVFILRAHSSFYQLWLWHAVEETEHKAVCFDVYETVVGKGIFAYLLRILAMLVFTFCFSVAPLIAFVFIKLGYRRKGRKLSKKQLRQQPSLLTRLRQKLKDWSNILPSRNYFAYFRYGFHPWDHDNSDLVAAWKARFPNFGSSPDSARAEVTAAS